MHDPRVGRFFALDPLAPKYAYNSPYAFSENRVMDGVELEGLEFEDLQTGFGFKLTLSINNNVKIDAVVYGTLANDIHSFAFNVNQKNGTINTNIFYAPTTTYFVRGTQEKVNAGGTVGGFPINFSINNCFNFVSDPDDKPQPPINNFGVGAGYNFFKNTWAFGVFTKKIDSSLNLPPTTFDGSTPISSFSPQLIETSATDNIEPTSLPIIGKLEIKPDKPILTNEEREKEIRTEEKKEKDKKEKDNETPMQKKLKAEIKDDIDYKPKFNPKAVKTLFNVAKSIVD